MRRERKLNSECISLTNQMYLARKTIIRKLRTMTNLIFDVIRLNYLPVIIKNKGVVCFTFITEKKLEYFMPYF